MDLFTASQKWPRQSHLTILITPRKSTSWDLSLQGLRTGVAWKAQVWSMTSLQTLHKYSERVCQSKTTICRSQHAVGRARGGGVVVLCGGGAAAGPGVHPEAVRPGAAPGRGLHLRGIPLEEALGDQRLWSVYGIPVLFSLIPV